MNPSINEAALFAQKYLEDLLSFFSLNTDVSSTIDDEVIQLMVPSTQLNGFLIGQNGENMRALQYLVTNALKSKNFQYFRINLDIADYKKHRADRLKEKAEKWMKDVSEKDIAIDLEPMNAADRRIIHQLAAEYNISSDSVGEGRDRHIVLKKVSSES